MQRENKYMKHLKSVKESYIEHMFQTWLTAFVFIVSGVICFIHSIFPFIFETTATTMVKYILERNNKRREKMINKIKSWFRKPVHHFQIRYNTEVGNGDLVWRIIVGGKEVYASSIEIHGYTYGEASIINGVRKMNIACDGKIYWNGSKARIITWNTDNEQ